MIFFAILLLMIKDGRPDTSRRGLIYAQVQGRTFNYIAWELDALWHKAQQALFGFQHYMSDDEAKAVVVDYLQLTARYFELDTQIETHYADANDAQNLRALQAERDDIQQQRQELQPFVEPIIQQHVATILIEEGFGVGGQVLPPVSFRFVEPPDILIVSPRAYIQQDYAISLEPLPIEDRVTIENNVIQVSPTDAAYITGVGGVGIWPSMVIETRWAAIAYEIVAHEWSHHYLFAFPSGQEYLVRPETRFINETVASVFGNAMAIKILERFYSEEVAQGMLWVPNYPSLEDFFLTNIDQPLDFALETPSIQRSTSELLLFLDRPAAAQLTMNALQQTEITNYQQLLENTDLQRFEIAPRGTMINRTRITSDFLLSLERIEAAEAMMENTRQILGMRVLNQAWFAFNGGYQASPTSGAGVASAAIVVDVTDPAYVGDPIGPAVHEIAALAPTLSDYLEILRDVTTRAELLDALIEARTRWQIQE